MLKDIALKRKLVVGTILDHLEKLAKEKRIDANDLTQVIDSKLRTALPKIKAAFVECDTQLLSPVHKRLKGAYSFDTLRLARLALALA